MQRTAALLLMCAVVLLTLSCRKQNSGSSGNTAVSTKGALQVTLHADPLKVDKPAKLLLNASLGGQPLTDADIHGILTMATMDMGKTELNFTPKGNGNYETETKFTMGGRWNINLAVKHGSETLPVQVSVNVPE